jgi:hypothetical protein
VVGGGGAVAGTRRDGPRGTPMPAGFGNAMVAIALSICVKQDSDAASGRQGAADRVGFVGEKFLFLDRIAWNGPVCSGFLAN